MKLRRRALLALTWLPLTAAANPPMATYAQISAGTGFLVNRSGDVVTNAHVVKACTSISVLGDDGETSAQLVATDPQHDLAVLRTSAPPRDGSVAPLRWNISDLRVGDSVVVMGFPGREGVTGTATYKRTTVSSLKGPAGETSWIQLNSVAQHGNSGGPVLDTDGHVIAVISGVAMTYKTDSQGRITGDMVGQSDIAITLAQLQDFLRKNNIGYYQATTGDAGAYGDDTLASNAHKFILPVHCVQGMVVAPAHLASN